MLEPLRSQHEPMPQIVARFLHFIISSYRIFGTETTRYTVAKYLRDNPGALLALVDLLLAQSASEVMIAEEEAQDALQRLLGPQGE